MQVRAHLLPVAAITVAATVVAVGIGGCGNGRPAGSAADGRIQAVGVESQYADVIARVGGSAVSVSAILDNPSADPHGYEVSASVANQISSARLIVRNGLGYDAFVNRVEVAAPNPGRRTVDVARLLGLPVGTANPHLWYAPSTMPKVAEQVAADLSALRPGQAAGFRAAARRFDASLTPWYAAIARIHRRFGGARVATTEPVADLLLDAAGLVNATPFQFQADVMNGVDLAPQQISAEESLLSRRRVRALVVNAQVTDSLTQRFETLARSRGIPVVGVYETMPRGLGYAGWMLAETDALERALATGDSTGASTGARTG